MASPTGVIPPPPGVTPQFDGMSSVQRDMIILFSVTFALATFFLALRLYTAACILRRFALDECLYLQEWQLLSLADDCADGSLPQYSSRWRGWRR